MGEDGRKKNRKQARRTAAPTESGGRESTLTAAQQAVNEQMRRALEEDQYSANGSIVDTDSDEDDHQYTYKGQSIRLDRNYLLQAARKHLWLERASGAPAVTPAENDDAENRRGKKPKRKKGKRGKEDVIGVSASKASDADFSSDLTGGDGADSEALERDEGSIFGQTTGSSNSTWVECDKCKKVRCWCFVSFCRETHTDLSFIVPFAISVAPSSWCSRRKETSFEMVLFNE